MVGHCKKSCSASSSIPLGSVSRALLDFLIFSFSGEKWPPQAGFEVTDAAAIHNAVYETAC